MVFDQRTKEDPPRILVHPSIQHRVGGHCHIPQDVRNASWDAQAVHSRGWHAQGAGA